MVASKQLGVVYPIGSRCIEKEPTDLNHTTPFFSFLFSLVSTMIAPITGKFRKQFAKDLSIALTLGGVAGACWWHLYHLPMVRRRDAYYARLEANKNQ